MILGRKTDAEEIKEHIKTLKTNTWLHYRHWWPDFLFHFSHIENAAKILNSGKLLSRARAKAAGVMIDSASPGIIETTQDQWKEHVRLYFRPRTPTQFNNEGFRPANSYRRGAHCPVPIVMLFDAADILTRVQTKFSDRNLRSANKKIGDNAAFLKSIPFDKVYHDSSLFLFDEAEKQSVISHRNAEAFVPNELDLSPLCYICCRTQAEHETLLHLLEPEALKAWSDKISLGTNWNLHYRRWTFVEQVELSRTAINFQFNPSSETPEPFRAQVEIREDATGEVYSLINESYCANSNLRLTLQPLEHPGGYTVHLKLDGRLAYCNHYTDFNVSRLI